MLRRGKVNVAAQDPRQVEPPELRRVRLAGALFAAVLVAGVVGYSWLTDASLLDSIYMTVITMTTVGYAEVIELDATGRIFTMGLLVSGVGTVTYGAISAAEFLVEGHLGRYIERRRMSARIVDLDRHVIVCGYGRTGRQIVDRLEQDGISHVVIESDERKAPILEAAGTPYLIGDATEDVILIEAGVERSIAVVAAVHSDADNVMVSLSTRGLAPDVTIVARSRTVENEQKLHRSGANHVITPAAIGGRRIAQLLARPTITAFLDWLGDDGTDLTLEEVVVPEALSGHTLGEAELPGRYGCTLLAIQRRGGHLEVHPGSETHLEAGDTLVVMGSEEDVTRLRAEQPETRPQPFSKVRRSGDDGPSPGPA